MIPGIVYSWSRTIPLDELEMYQFFAILSKLIQPKWGTTTMKLEMERPYTYPVIAFMNGLKYRFKQNTRLRR